MKSLFCGVLVSLLSTSAHGAGPSHARLRTSLRSTSANRLSPPRPRRRDDGSAQTLADLKRMSDPALEGREPGLPQYRTIAAYGADQLAQAGIKPLANTGAGAERYFQPFTWKENLYGPGGSSVNVVGVRPGAANNTKAVVVVAHLDHIKGFGGANDNASGSAVLLGIARRLTPAQLQKNVIFLLTSAEEKGLLGAQAFLNQGVAKKAGYDIDEVVNFDMVGAGPTKQLLVFGGETAAQADANRVYRGIMGLGTKSGLQMLPGHEHDNGEHVFRRNDQLPFAMRGLPTALITGGLVGPYHSPEDTLDKLNLPKLQVTLGLGAGSVTEFANDLSNARAPRQRWVLSPRGLHQALVSRGTLGSPRSGGERLRYRQITREGEYLVDAIGPSGAVRSLTIDPVSGAAHAFAHPGKAATAADAVRALARAGRLPDGAAAHVDGLSASGQDWHVRIEGGGAVDHVLVDRFDGRVRADTTPKRWLR